MALSIEELDEEIHAVKNMINVHEEAVKQNLKGVKVNAFLLEFLEAERAKFK